MEMLSDTTAAIKTEVNTAVATGGAAVITLAAADDSYNIVDYVSCSYAAAPDAESTITVADASGTLFKQYVSAAGPAHFQFGDGGLPGTKGEAVTITLSDGSQKKNLCVKYR